MTRLDEAAIAAELERTPGWSRQGDAIARTYRLRDFRDAMLFVNAVAALAERAAHHPDVAIHYDSVTLTLWTHAAGGLTARDFALARTIDAWWPVP